MKFDDRKLFILEKYFLLISCLNCFFILIFKKFYYSFAFILVEFELNLFLSNIMKQEEKKEF